MRRAALIAIIAIAVLPGTTWAQETETQDMSFDSCVGLIAKMATQFGVAPINIVETTALRIVRFTATDGSVVMTCSRDDGKMILTKSPHQ